MSETRLTYNFAALGGDYLRAGMGLAATVLPLLFLHPAPTLQWVLVALALLFAFFGLRTWTRHRTVVTLDAAGVESQSPLPGTGSTRIDWDTLKKAKLAYYTTRRRPGSKEVKEESGVRDPREKGWLELTLTGQSNEKDGKIVVDSAANGFDRLIEATADRIAHQGIAIDPASAHNFAALGHAIRPNGRTEEGGPKEDDGGRSVADSGFEGQAGNANDRG